jgi:hypothetical protein
VPNTPELVAWDVFDAILTPGDITLLSSWNDKAAADAFSRDGAMKDGAGVVRSALCAITACSIGGKRRSIIPTPRRPHDACVTRCPGRAQGALLCRADRLHGCHASLCRIFRPF